MALCHGQRCSHAPDLAALGRGPRYDLAIYRGGTGLARPQRDIGDPRAQARRDDPASHRGAEPERRGGARGRLPDRSRRPSDRRWLCRLPHDLRLRPAAHGACAGAWRGSVRSRRHRSDYPRRYFRQRRHAHAAASRGLPGAGLAGLQCGAVRDHHRHHRPGQVSRREYAVCHLGRGRHRAHHRWRDLQHMRKTIVLNDPKTRIAKPHRPKAAPAQGSWIIEAGGGGGGGAGGVPAPPVQTPLTAEIFWRGDHTVEVDVPWTAAVSANAQNFAGVYVYLEDPDISSGANGPMDGAAVALDASAQVSGDWAPAFQNISTKSPAVVFPNGDKSYQTERKVRIYLAAYGPYSQPQLVRATDPNPTPNVLVDIPLGRGQGESGQEYAFLVTNVRVDVKTDYNRADPQYTLTFFYDPPDPTAPVPPGMNRFGGCRIIFVYEDASGNPQFPGTDTGLDVPVAQSQNGFNSPAYAPGPTNNKFRAYFCSEDDSQPLGNHINSLAEGVTPYAEVTVPHAPGAPAVTDFTISHQQALRLLDGSLILQATFAWTLPDESVGRIRYAGVFLYLVAVAGGSPPLTKFPQALTAQQSNVDTGFVLSIPNGLGAVIPAATETWTIAAISADVNGALADVPSEYGQAGFQSPTVTWNVGPPKPGDPGSGLEFAPAVTVLPDAAAQATDSLSADGVGMVTFDLGPWTNPADNAFGGVQVAMVVNHDTTKPTMWTVANGATSFTTPSMPSFGNLGSSVPVDFYLVSDDPQGHKNSLQPGTTPVIHYVYKPTEGKVIPAREGWFDPTQFAWSGDGFTAQSFSAKVIQVGSKIIVGGAPSTFGGNDYGQIAVLDKNGKLLDWLGQQQTDQGDGSTIWGAWLGQVWIGGSSPKDAPVFVDNQGIIQVGGIAAAQGARFPYLSIRDDHGFEKGRIGAQINQPSSSPGDATGPNPPLSLSSGAWFTQLAVGGNNLSNWNMLVVPDSANPLGSQFQIRNVNLFLIDYAAQQGIPSNDEFQLKMGNSVWTGAGTTGQWQFPGIQIYKVDGGNQFGSVLLSRGLVLRGTPEQNYHVLASLITYNGQDSGVDIPRPFWGELAMYGPLSPFYQTVYLASGSLSNGSAFFVLRNFQNALNFEVDQAGNTYVGGVLQGAPDPATSAGRPVNALAYNVNGYGPVIDAAGKWLGQPIAVAGAAQTPWTQPIEGAGFNLSHAGNISANGSMTALQYMVNASGNPVIDQNGAFRGAGVNVGTFGIGCGGLTVSSAPGVGGEIDCGLFKSDNNAVVTRNVNPASLPGTGWIVGDNLAAVADVGCNTLHVAGKLAINNLGQFVGPGVSTDQGIGCGYLAVNGRIDCGPIKANGDMQATRFLVNASGNPVIDQFGRFLGAGVDVGNQGIGCGSLQVASSPGIGGPITCGSLTCSGALSIVTLSVTGNISAGQYLMANGGVVIDGNGRHLGAGVDVQGYGIGCGHIDVRAGWTGGGDGIISCSGINTTGNSRFGGNVWATYGFVVGNDGWTLSDSSHNLYFSQLWDWSWNQSRPIIGTDGVFRGGAVDVGGGSVNAGVFTGGQFQGAGVYCPSYGLRCGSLDAGGGPINGGNIGLTGSIYAPGGFSGGGFTGSYINTGGSITSSGSISCNSGSIYSAGGYTGGAFTGAGVNCPGYGLGCYSVNPQGWSGQNFTVAFHDQNGNPLQLWLNGVNQGYVQLRFVGGVLVGTA